MRQFLVLAHEAPTTPDFSLDDLPGEGRLDLLARCVTSALLRSHGIREESRLYLLLGGEYALRVEGSEVQGLNPDERSTAARIRSALERREDAIGHEEVETSPGIYLSRRDLATVIEAVARDSTVILLQEDGGPISELAPPSNPAFVLSDHREFSDEEDEVLANYVNTRASLGPTAIHADQAISVAHNYLDTRGFADY